MKKRLFNADSDEVRRIRRQAILVPGLSSELEVALKKCYNQELLSMDKNMVVTQPVYSTPAPNASRTPSGMEYGQTIKIHLKRVTQGPGWTHVEPKDAGPDIRQQYMTPQQSESSPQSEPRWRKSDDDTVFLCEEEDQAEAAGQSPLTDKLLPPSENVTDMLDYEDDLQDPEFTMAVANIPP